MDGDWIVTKANGVNAEGKATNYSNRYKMDGKAYPYKTATVDGTITAKRIDDFTTEAQIKGPKGGATTSRAVISKDGKTRTLTTKGTNDAGKQVDSVIVYEKQ
jgi:hypothetical protein